MTQQPGSIIFDAVDAGAQGHGFSGTYPKALDRRKGRVPIPKEFRDLLGVAEQVVVARPLDERAYLEVWPVDVWKQRLSQIEALTGQVDYETIARWYNSQSKLCNLDTQGRLVIPPYFREKGGLDEDVLWVGMGKRMEIWAQASFEQAEPDMLRNAIEVAMRNQDKLRL